MALILCIETSTEICSVAIALNGNILSLQEIEEGNAHASKLHVLVQQVLIDCGFVLKQVNAVAVSKGPGSYTGLRVGVSAAKGYCYALAIPLIAIDSLSCLGSKYLINNNISTNQLLVPMIDARRMEVYTAVFNKNLEVIRVIEAKIIDECSFLPLLQTNELIFIGNGAPKCNKVILHANAYFTDLTKSGADGLANLAEIMYQKKQFENTAYFEPFYLKDFVGTKAKVLKPL